jgi:phosphoribosyl-AMP cyclohydrolase
MAQFMDEKRDNADQFMPRFDAAGLVTAIVTDADDGGLLMVAHMNQQAIDLSFETGQVHFWSRSRQAMWRKGETSGNGLTLVDILVDCDQDALLVRVRPAGPSCHTGRRSCFYRRLGADGSLTFLDSPHSHG